MPTELRRRTEKHKGNFNKEIETLRKYQTEITELKNAVTELKNALEGFNSRLDEAKEQISELEDKAMELTQTDKKKEKIIFKNEDK